MFLPYVYKVVNRITGDYYIGMRSANKVVAELDLGIRYFTSSKKVKENFHLYDPYIIAYFVDWSSAFEFENALIKESWGDPHLINKHYQRDISKFSMQGYKRPDVSLLNSKIKRKPREIRRYTCLNCSIAFTKEEIVTSPVKQFPVCSKSCSASYNGKTSAHKTRGIPKVGHPAWNKGIPNPQAADNAKRGGPKQSIIATGRKRLYREDGSWTWYYPKE